MREGSRSPSTGTPPAANLPLTAALWMLADRGVSLLFGLVMTWHLTRYLGVEGYGYYTLAATVVTAFALIADLVGGQVVVREVAARPEQADRVVGTALVLRGLLGCLALVICWLSTVGYPAPVRTAILLLSLTLLLAPYDALGALMQARLRLRTLSLIGMGATLLNLVLLMAAIASGAGLALVTAVLAAPAAFRAVATALLFWRESRGGGAQAPRHPVIALGADLKEARRLFCASWPLAVGSLLSQIPGSLPQLYLSHRVDDALGIFAAASRIPAMLSILPTTVMVALFPLMARAWSARDGTPSSARAVAGVLDRSYAALLALALPITISCVVLAPEALRILYGAGFASAVAGLRVIALSLIVMYPGIAAGNMLVAMGRERIGLLITAGGAALSTLLTPLLAGALGATGAASAQAIVYTAMGVASLTAVARLRRGSQRTSALASCAGSWYHRIAGCALVMTGVVVLLRRVDPFAAFALGLVTYALCLWLTGLMPIVLRLPTLEALGRGGDAPPVDRPTLLYRIARRMEGRLTEGFWNLAVRGARRAVRHEAGGRSQVGGSDCIHTGHRAPGTGHGSAATPRILVVDTDYIGDVILATPVLVALKRRFPNSMLTLATAPGVAPLMAAHPAVDRVVALETNAGLLNAVRLHRALRALAPQEVTIGLSAVPANAWVGHVAGMLASAPLRLGEAHGRYAGCLTHAVERETTPRHWSQIHHAVLRPLGIEDAKAPPCLESAEPARQAVEQLLARLGTLPRPWIGVHPGGRIYRIPDPALPDGVAQLSRRWPEDRFVELTRRLLSGSATLFLTGSEEDASATGAILRAVTPIAGSRLVDTTGRLTLPETAALIEKMEAFVTNDTGPMHLACALGVPTVALFGPTDPRRAGPLPGSNRHQILAPDLPCAPCGGEALVPCRNPAGQECLTAIPVEQVYQAVMAALGSGPRALGGSQSLPTGTNAAAHAYTEPRAQSPEREER